jgi:hypothetical protein
MKSQMLIENVILQFDPSKEILEAYIHFFLILF